MRKIVICLNLMLFASTIVFGQIKVHTNGNTTVGTRPANGFGCYTEGEKELEVALGDGVCPLYITPNGNDPNITARWGYTGVIGASDKKFYEIYSYQIYSENSGRYSDKRIKENLTNLDSVLQKLMYVKSWRYDIKPEFYKNTPEQRRKELIEQGKNKIGFVAQELMQVFPELVSKTGDDGMYVIDYTSMIPILTEALKIQQAQIEKQDERIATLEKKMKTLEAKLEAIETDNSETNLKKKAIIDNELSGKIKATLYQNHPNPFTDITTIRYELPDNINSAILYIYDMQGTQIRSIPVEQRGKSSVRIQGNVLQPGMYLYTLIADGKEVDTKRMIVTN